MTEQSNQSDNPSQRDGLGFLTPSERARLGSVNARALAVSKNRARPIGESIPKIPTPSPITWTGPTSRDPIVLSNAADVPRRHQREVCEEPQAWVNVRERVLKGMASGFMVALIGKRGPGKTQIAEQAINHACSLQWPALYVRAMTIFLDLRATFKSESDTEASIIERYRSPKLLVIDEMQERGETPWEDRMLNHLIDLRYGDMTDTLLIANLTRKAMKKSLGESISERLRETGGIIECTWPSFRKAEAKEK